MSEKWAQTGFLDPVEQGGKIHRGIETGCLDEERVGILADGQHFAGVQSLFKERIHHVLSGKMEYHRPVPSLLKDGEAGAQIGWRVGIVFHHMRRQPDFPNPLLGIPAKHGQCIVCGLYSVVHTGKNVAMPIRPAPQETGLQQRFLPSE